MKGEIKEGKRDRGGRGSKRAKMGEARRDSVDSGST